MSTPNGFQQKAYQYTPLRPGSHEDPEFRLLTLLPGRFGSRIEIHMTHVPLKSPPIYEALSYTWGDPKGPYNYIPAVGDPTSTYQIALNAFPFTIVYNLERALQQLRHEFENRTLWIDAICINQEDGNEKSEQVAVMASIFEKASRVVAWLGEHDEYVDLAFDTLDEICWASKVAIIRYCSIKLKIPLVEVSLDDVMLLVKSELRKPQSMVSSPFRDLHTPASVHRFQEAMGLFNWSALVGHSSLVDLATHTWGYSGSLAEAIIAGQHEVSQLPNLDDRWKALFQTFYNRAYWKRVWIVQEVILSANLTFICGDRSFDLKMMELIRCLDLPNADDNGSSILAKNADSRFLGNLRTKLTILRDFSFNFGEQKSELLSSIIIRHSHKLCSEPRDAIFGLLNLSNVQYIVPDYTDPVEHVYTSATRKIIAHERNLNIIVSKFSLDQSKAYGCPPRIKLPTWVPHFECMLSVYSIYNYLLPFSHQFYKGGGLLRDNDLPRPGEDHRILQLTGCFYGAIQEAKQTMSTYYLNAKRKMWYAMTQLRSNPDIAEDCLDIEFWRALLTDMYPPSNAESSRRITTNPGSLAMLKADLQEARQSEPPFRLLDELKLQMREKAFCKTTKGNLGLVLGDVLPGDLVFVARGATNPLIIRQVQADSSFDEYKKAKRISTFYELVGGSYIHGIMDGEVLAMKGDEGVISQEGVKEETVFLI